LRAARIINGRKKRKAINLQRSVRNRVSYFIVLAGGEVHCFEPCTRIVPRSPQLAEWEIYVMFIAAAAAATAAQMDGN
jgi:hypothetical protein